MGIHLRNESRVTKDASLNPVNDVYAIEIGEVCTPIQLPQSLRVS